jgi:hypothetical protein
LRSWSTAREKIDWFFIVSDNRPDPEQSSTKRRGFSKLSAFDLLPLTGTFKVELKPLAEFSFAGKSLTSGFTPSTAPDCQFFLGH